MYTSAFTSNFLLSELTVYGIPEMYSIKTLIAKQ